MNFEGIVTRILQFVVLSFFTYVVFVWYGATALLLLATWVQFAGIVGVITGMFIALPLTLFLMVFFCFYIMRSTRFFEVFDDIGRSLFRLGYRSVMRISRKEAPSESVQQS